MIFSHYDRKATESDSVAKQTPGPAGARPTGKNCSPRGQVDPGAPPEAAPLNVNCEDLIDVFPQFFPFVKPLDGI